MPDSITVTFGGREVVLKRADQERRYWEGERLTVIYWGDTDYAAAWEISPNDAYVRADGDSPQAAVSAVETKLRNLVEEINVVLGGKE